LVVFLLNATLQTCYLAVEELELSREGFEDCPLDLLWPSNSADDVEEYVVDECVIEEATEGAYEEAEVAETSSPEEFDAKRQGRYNVHGIGSLLGNHCTFIAACPFADRSQGLRYHWRASR
jgi:hypothetical protein